LTALGAQPCSVHGISGGILAGEGGRLTAAQGLVEKESTRTWTYPVQIASPVHILLEAE